MSSADPLRRLLDRHQVPHGPAVASRGDPGAVPAWYDAALAALGVIAGAAAAAETILLRHRAVESREGGGERATPTGRLEQIPIDFD